MKKRNVVATDEFYRWVKKEKVPVKAVESTILWAQVVQFVDTSRNKPLYSSSTEYQIWNARLPDPDSNKGKSGGFRLTYYYVKSEDKIYLQKIVRSNNRGFKKEAPRKKQADQKYLKQLKKELTEIYG